MIEVLPEPEPTGPPREPVKVDLGEPETVGELIGTAIGAGSMCWQHVERAGVFDSTRAAAIVEDVLTRLGRMGIPATTPLTAIAEMGPGDNAPAGHVCGLPEEMPTGARVECSRGCGRRFKVTRGAWVPA